MNNIVQLLTSQLAAAGLLTDVGCGPVIRSGDAARFTAAIDAASQLPFPAAISQLAAATYVRGEGSPPRVPVPGGDPPRRVRQLPNMDILDSCQKWRVALIYKKIILYN